jgi:TetR/AcrR family transcriptional regulator, transcriptional repressor of bet genes
MRTREKKTTRSVQIPRARSGHSRQRQRLIDACISALHIYGPSRTTVEKVVAIAKMSPGIVRFYFASKAAMLVASLQFLAAEFEEQLLVPVMRLKSRPVAALELMVDLYLDPEIASPRKVSVWYAFWGEASSRQEYYDICGQKDQSFAVLVRELIEQMIIDTSQPQLDPDGIALGLIGVLEMLWQDFAFQNEADIDRPSAKRRARAYLRSIFPGQFSSSSLDASAAAGSQQLAAWVYCNARLFAMERDYLFADSWQFVGLDSQIPLTGDFLGVDLGVERVLVVRDTTGEARAFRNSCSEAPHILNPAARGHVESIQCTVHGLQYELDGRRRSADRAAGLSALELRLIGNLILVRSADHDPHASALDSWAAIPGLAEVSSWGMAVDLAIAADWKLVVEQWLVAPPSGSAVARVGWSARLYASLAASFASADWQRHFLAPNQLVEIRPDGMTIFQVLPVAAGRCVLRENHFSRCAEERVAGAAQYLASRLSSFGRRASITMTESTQVGLVTLGHEGSHRARAAAADFRRYLIAGVPAMARIRAPTDP